MSRQATLILILVVGVLGFQNAMAQYPDVLGWWPLNEGEGTVAVDISGNGNDGTLEGSPEWIDDADHGMVLSFGGGGDHVDTPVIIPAMTLDNAFTWLFWCNQVGDGGGANMVVLGNRYGGSAAPVQFIKFTPTRFEYYSDAHVGTIDYDDIPAEEWVHMATVMDGDSLTHYRNGVEAGSNTATVAIAENPFSMGGDATDGAEYWTGSMSDVALFTGALTEAQIQDIMAGMGLTPELPSAPLPTDAAADVSPDTVLSWNPGAYAASHDVYLGTDFTEVSEATTADAAYMGNQQQNSYDPEHLALGQTYYWRIDEVNAAPDNTVFKGPTWSFEAEPVSFAIPIGAVTATASSMDGVQGPNNTVNGSGLNENDEHSVQLGDMWSSASTDMTPWIQYEFSQVEKLDKVHVWNHNTQTEAFLGFGIKEALIETSVDGETWSEFGTVELAQAPGNATYTGVAVSLDMIVAKYVKITALSNYSILGLPQRGLAEVRFYAVPMRARREIPAAGSAGLDPLIELTWRAGREAVKHEILTGTDPDNLTLVATVDEAAYTAVVDMNSTVYLQVNEINDAMDPASWEGQIWEMATAEYITVDDMESYKSTEGFYVWETWVDGFGDDNNGALLGHNGDDMETDAAYDGSQSLPYYYGQGGSSSSEAFRDIERDWGQHGVVSLSLMFQGQPSNTPGQIYIKVNDEKVGTYPTTSDLLIPQWFAWTIDLPASALGDVKSLAIGVDGGTGMVLIDAIRLYAKASETVAPEAPSDDALVASYPFEGNFNDASGNGLDGTPIDNASILSDPVRGQALSLDGIAACVDVGGSDVFNPQGSFSLAAWANIGEFINDWGHVLIAKRGENDLGWQLRRHSGTENLTFTLRGTTGADDPQGNVSMVPFYGEWVHVTAVYDIEGGQRTVYINGIVDVSIADTDPVASTDHNVYIGARATSGNDGAEGFFSGMLDDVRVYSRPLSQAEALGLAGRSEPIFKGF